MPTYPRVVIVDPTGNLTPLVRGALDLMDHIATLIEIPSTADALEEMHRGSISLLITAWHTGDEMPGWELAARVKAEQPHVAAIVVGDINDPQDVDPDTPFLYIQRPLDVHYFLRLIDAGIDGQDITQVNIRQTTSTASVVVDEFGLVPTLDQQKASTVISELMADLSPLGIILASREGNIIVEQGTAMIDRKDLAQAVRPMVSAHVQVRNLVGGNATSVQFYDGEEHAVFALTVGWHHILCLIFNAENANRQFAFVNRYGGMAVQKLIDILGVNAWLIEKPRELEKSEKRVIQRRKATQEMEKPIELERASIIENASHVEEDEKPKMEAIDVSIDDLAGIFGDGSKVEGEIDLFDMDRLAEIANSEEGSDKLDWDSALTLGLID
ncbi:hypothetical protein MASR2M15_24740 [Anaerolineales bacterium]